MKPDDVSYWLAIVLPAIATFAGVLLAFWLDRVAERRRQDAAAFWMARHWVRSTARNATDDLLSIALRRIFNGRSAPSRAEVQRQLSEVDPEVAWWWTNVTLNLVDTKTSSRGHSGQAERTWEWADRVDAELVKAGRAWPIRRVRLRRLTTSMPLALDVRQER